MVVWEHTKPGKMRLQQKQIFFRNCLKMKLYNTFLTKGAEHTYKTGKGLQYQAGHRKIQFLYMNENNLRLMRKSFIQNCRLANCVPLFTSNYCSFLIKTPGFRRRRIHRCLNQLLINSFLKTLIKSTGVCCRLQYPYSSTQAFCNTFKS
jgi:hypothetical protein